MVSRTGNPAFGQGFQKFWIPPQIRKRRAERMVVLQKDNSVQSNDLMKLCEADCLQLIVGF